MATYCVKLNKTMLENGKITIANDEINSLIDVSNWELGHKEEVILKFNNNDYRGTIAYKNRSRGNPYYQLSYRKDLNKALKKEFIHTFLAIKTETIPYDERSQYHITTDQINREVLKFKSNEDGTIDLIPFLKMKTEYDEFFKKIIQWNILDLNDSNNEELTEDIIQYSSDWIPIGDLTKHKDAKNAVYYLLDSESKEIYIGCCDVLGTRVKPKRKEIPGWNMFKYEIIKPRYWSIKEKIESHSIRAFASFLENGAHEPYFKISEYKLKNRNWAKRK